jgi:hypothetical protein
MQLLPDKVLVIVPFISHLDEGSFDQKATNIMIVIMFTRLNY